MSDREAPAIRWGEAWYWRLRRKMAPGLRNAQYAYLELLEAQLQTGDRWLDLGCGRRIAPSWMRYGIETEMRLIDRAGEVVGVDPDLDALKDNTLPIRKLHAEAERLPLPDETFDLITANMVFEHLDDPLSVLNESARLLRPGGRLLIHTPNVLYPVTLAAACMPTRLRTGITAWLEKRPVKDIYPTRYRMNHAARIRRLAERARLDVVTIGLTSDSPELIALGPLVALELGLIALTRSRFGAGIASNLLITLTKPEAAAFHSDRIIQRVREAAPSLGAAA